MSKWKWKVWGVYLNSMIIGLNYVKRFNIKWKVKKLMMFGMELSKFFNYYSIFIYASLNLKGLLYKQITYENCMTAKIGQNVIKTVKFETKKYFSLYKIFYGQ